MSVLFVKEVKPQTIEENGCKYEAGQLSYIGRRSLPAVTNMIHRHLKAAYGWTVEKNDSMPRSVQGIVNIMTDVGFVVVLGCDFTESLTPAQLFEWDEDFINKCFDLALELNPKLKAKKEDEPDTGEAQPGTHHPDGTPKTEEETDPN